MSPTGVFLPNSAFASLGLEHCVANMFLLSTAIVSGAPITPMDALVKNLVPATLGKWLRVCPAP